MNLFSDIDAKAQAKPLTAADVIHIVEQSDLSASRRRDVISALNRLCTFACKDPAFYVVSAEAVRQTLDQAHPRAHGISAKTFSNIRNGLGCALALAGIIEPDIRNRAKEDPGWAPFAELIAKDKALSLGLARFMNFCALCGIDPEEVTQKILLAFVDWMRSRTILAKIDENARAAPKHWNRASELYPGWPRIRLEGLSMSTKRRITPWNELPEAFREDAEAYIEKRRAPDLFDEDPDAPSRPLAPRTIEQQQTHIRLAYDVLAADTALTAPCDLGGLVEPDAIKAVLRTCIKPEKQPSAHALAIGKTLLQIARFHVGVRGDDYDRLRKIVAGIPAPRHDLTEKNKALLARFESQKNLQALLRLPDELILPALRDPTDKRHWIKAQCGLAITILLVAPLRNQNLSALEARHFQEPNGPRGNLRLVIPKEELKAKHTDLVFELDRWTSDLIRRYRKTLLPAMGADRHGPLFAKPGGGGRAIHAVGNAVTKAIRHHLGIPMSPHQFRHLAAKLYLDVHPHDFETVRALLGHSSARTTLIYSGLNSQRASRAFTAIVEEQRASGGTGSRNRKGRLSGRMSRKH